MLNIIKNPRTSFGVFGGNGSLEVAIEDHDPLEVAFIIFLMLFLLFDCIKMAQDNIWIVNETSS
jgi:hypothetical protein